MSSLLRSGRRFRFSASSPTSVPVLWCPTPASGEATAASGDGGELSTVQVLSWGRGSSGQLGGGKEEIRFYPTPVASVRLPPGFRLAPSPGCLPAAAATPSGGEEPVEIGISCGLFHSGLFVDGKLWMWGKGDGGRLGFGHEVSAFVPTLNPNMDGVRSVALGGLHSAALTRRGEVFTWGYGGFGALGHSVYHRELLPRLVNGPWSKSISQMSTSGAHTAAVSESDTGKLYMWGNARDCQLGVPGLPDVQPSPIEVRFLCEEEELGPHHVLQVAVGASHAMCLVSRQRTSKGGS